MKHNGGGRWTRLVAIGLVALLYRGGAARSDVLEVTEAALSDTAKGQVVVRGDWGTEPGQFGKVDEASRPGPMDFAVVDRTLYVLDPVNARVQVFDLARGFLRAIPIGTKTADFLDVDESGTVAVLDAFVRHEFKVFDASGAQQQHAKLPSSIKLASAIQLDAGRVWIEERHDRMFEMDTAHAADGEEARVVRGLPGRPALNGRSLHASKTPDGQVRVRIASGERAEATHAVKFPGQVRSIVGLESDQQEHIYVAVRRENAGPAGRSSADIVVAKLSLDGRLLGSAVMPDAYVTDHYRKLFVTASGEIIQMQTAEDGVRFVRWTFGAPGGKRSRP